MNSMEYNRALSGILNIASKYADRVVMNQPSPLAGIVECSGTSGQVRRAIIGVYRSLAGIDTSSLNYYDVILNSNSETKDIYLDGSKCRITTNTPGHFVASIRFTN